MTLAAAQTRPKRRDIKWNLQDHCNWIKKAADKGASFIVFPELSISGYERENLDSLIFEVGDPKLDPLRQLSVDRKIIVVAGAPIIIGTKLMIGEFIIHPHHPEQIYTKQYLHPGEEVSYCSSFDVNPIIQLGSEIISLAICANIDHPEHPEMAGRANTTIYVPSIFFSPKGIPSAHKNLSGYAKKHSMSVLMANFTGESGGMPAAGKSAFWNNDGKLVKEMGIQDAGLLLVEKNGDDWRSQIYTDQ